MSYKSFALCVACSPLFQCQYVRNQFTLNYSALQSDGAAQFSMSNFLYVIATVLEPDNFGDIKN